MTEVRARLPSTAGRRANAVAAVVADGVLLLLIHVWPGWEVVPFLTDGTTRVLPYVDAALVAGIVVGLLQLARPRGASAPAGTLVTTAFGLAATVRVLQVFPFDLSGGWEVVVRVVLWLGIAGGVVGILVALGALLRLRPARR
ncbi:hypothetical protein ACI8AA_02825 [Geodermatophilus sp. SYSU D01180]